jgi:hypothetical protein
MNGALVGIWSPLSLELLVSSQQLSSPQHNGQHCSRFLNTNADQLRATYKTILTFRMPY